jgi:hypothetical protein
VFDPSREIWSPAHEKNVTDRHANDRGHSGEHPRSGWVRQQLFVVLVDDEHGNDDEHPRDHDAHDDSQAQVQTGLLSRRFIAATRHS